jgi:hypothetical protein
MATVVMVFDIAQNPLKTNNHHAMATVEKHIHRYHIRLKISQQQQMITKQLSKQPALLVAQIDYCAINVGPTHD